MSKTRISQWIHIAALGLAASVTLALPMEILGHQTPASASSTSVLGIYGGENPTVEDSLCLQTGSQCNYAMAFLDGSTWQKMKDPSWFISQFAGSNYSMIWGVSILPSEGNYSLAAGATGAYNQYFVTLAQGLVSGGEGNSIIRLGWEFNEGWPVWAAKGQAANFVSYWQQIVTSMRSVPGANFRFEWNPASGDQGAGNLASYYPGNQYVDLIGLDVYDISWGSYPGAASEFSTIETEPYGLNWLASFATQQGKPMTLPEWGLGWGASDAGAPVAAPGTETSGGDDPTFINDMAGWIVSHDVYEATFWDVNQSAVSATQNPNSLASFAADFKSPTSTTSSALSGSGAPGVGNANSGSTSALGVDPTTSVQVTPTLASSVGAPKVHQEIRAVSVHFTGSSASLDLSARNKLISLAKSFRAGTSVMVVGRSYHNAKLARLRAHNIVGLISSRVRVRVSVEVATNLRSDVSTVTR